MRRSRKRITLYMGLDHPCGHATWIKRRELPNSSKPGTHGLIRHRSFSTDRPVSDVLSKGHFYLPTILVDVDEKSKVIQEEVFGPALPIIRVKDLDEALQKANNSIYGLGSSVWTRDLDKATRAAEQLEAGYTWINSPQIIFDELPFGGLKQSGLGKEHGSEALDYYMETKSVVVARESRGE